MKFSNLLGPLRNRVPLYPSKSPSLAVALPVEDREDFQAHQLKAGSTRIMWPAVISYVPRVADCPSALDAFGRSPYPVALCPRGRLDMGIAKDNLAQTGRPADGLLMKLCCATTHRMVDAWLGLTGPQFDAPRLRQETHGLSATRQPERYPPSNRDAREPDVISVGPAAASGLVAPLWRDGCRNPQRDPLSSGRPPTTL
jgi:hypothetical protein